MTKLDAEIIVQLAENKLNTTQVARNLYLARNTVVYHIARIKDKTKKDPLDFYDMCVLLPLARKTLYGELGLSEETRNALEQIGRIAHGGRDE